MRESSQKLDFSGKQKKVFSYFVFGEFFLLDFHYFNVTLPILCLQSYDLNHIIGVGAGGGWMVIRKKTLNFFSGNAVILVMLKIISREMFANELKKIIISNTKATCI